MFAEQQTEWIINNILTNKGWKIDGNDKLKNVYFQKPKLEVQKQKLKGNKPDYILYETGTNNPIAIIEAKKSGADLRPALEQGIKYAKLLAVPLVFAMNGAYCETCFVQNNEELILNGEEVKELLREKEILEFIRKKTNKVCTIPEEIIISRNDLIRIFEDLNDVLRAEGLRAGIERFSEFANILFLKLLSENNEKSWWESIKTQSDDDLIGYINGYVIEQVKNKYGGGVFTPLSIKNPRTLRHIINEIDPLILSTINTDIKGDAFEYFLEKTTSTQNDLGEYFTPRNVVKTIVDLVVPKLGEKIYDPFCGTGGFLTEIFNYIKENNIIKGGASLKQLKEKTLYGGEITTTARIAKMNMILHGDGHSGVKQIDSLANPQDKSYDLIVTNMPFSQTITRKIKENGKTKTENLISPLYYNGLAKNNGDAACVLHCLRSLKQGGRMALVVPEGFLFRKELTEARKFLLSNANLRIVISLPPGAFLPYTGVKTNILFFTNAHQPNKQKFYWYFEVKNMGVTLDSHKRKIKGANDLNKIGSSNIKKADHNTNLNEDLLEAGFEIVDLAKIKKNNWNLVGSIYRETTRHGKYKFVKLMDLIKFSRGFSYKSSILSKSGIPMYNLKSVKKDFSSCYDFKFIKQDIKIPDRYLCTKGELLMAITDLTPTSEIIGRVIIVEEDGVFSMDLAKIEIKSSLISSEYMYCILNGKEFLEEAKKFSVGSNVKHLNLDNILSIQIPIPPLEEQQKVIKELKDKQEMIENHKRKIQEIKKDIMHDINFMWKPEYEA